MGKWEPTSLGLILLAAVDQKVSWALRAEWEQQVLDQRRDEGQGQHHSPVVLRSQGRLQTSHLRRRHKGKAMMAVLLQEEQSARRLSPFPPGCPGRRTPGSAWQRLLAG